MKKIFFLIIIIYFCLGTTLLILSREKPNQVEILTLKQNYSRLLSDVETIDIPIFISSNQTFFTSVDTIANAYLITEEYEMQVDINDIRDTLTMIRYNNHNYYLYYLETSFESIDMIDTEISLTNAILEITYINEVVFDFEVGNFNLIFKEIVPNNHLDIMHLFGIMNEHDNLELSIKAICLKMDNLTNQDVFIQSIDLNTEIFDVILSESTYLDEAPLPDTDILEIFPSYESYGQNHSQVHNLKVIRDKYLVIPIKYHGQVKSINRFPIIINYYFNNQEYQYILDDFLFFDQNLNLELVHERIQKYEYRYPTSK